MFNVSARRLRWSRLTWPVIVLLLGICTYSYRWLTPTLPFASGSNLRSIGYVFDPQSPFKTGDQIVQVNGRSPDAWIESGLAGLSSLHHTRTYQVTIMRLDENVQTLTASATFIPFHLAMLWWSSAVLLGLGSVFVSAIIGLLGGYSPAEHGVRIAFLGLGLYFGCAIPLTGAPPLSWMVVRLLMPLEIISIGLTSGIFVFFLGYPRPVRYWHPRLMPIAIYSVSIILASGIVAVYAGDLITRSSFVTKQIVNGLSGLHTLLAIGFGVYAYRQTDDPLVRAQFRWLVWGGIVGLMPWLTLWAIPNVLWNEPLIPFLTLVYLPMLALPTSFALAILRYRLLDVDTVLSRTLIYILLTLGMAGVYAISTALFSQILPLFFGISNGVVVFLTALLLAALFNPALRLAHTFIERVFYRGRQHLLREVEMLRNELRYVEGWETLLPLLSREIPRRLGISSAQLLVWYEEHFVPLLLPDDPEPHDSTVTLCIIRFTLPADWPLEQPLLLQNWVYTQATAHAPGNQQHEPVSPSALPDNPLALLLAAGFQLAFVLVAGGQPVGIYALGRQRNGDWYDRSTITALESLADRIGIAVENARLLEQTAIQASLQHELTIARHIQESLLPDKYLRHHQLEAAALTLPASDVGGDLFTIQPFRDGRLAAAVGDVSGKGIGAALLMAVTSVMLTTVALEGDPPATLLTRLDRLLRVHTIRAQQNVALCYLQLYPTATAEYQVIAASAGAIPLLIRRADGRLEWLPMEGLPLGTVMAPSGYQAMSATFAVGDLLIVCTDGFVEAYNGNHSLLGFQGVEQVLAEAPIQQGAQAILSYLLEQFRIYTNGHDIDDDVTLLVIYYTMQNKEAPAVPV